MPTFVWILIPFAFLDLAVLYFLSWIFFKRPRKWPLASTFEKALAS